MIERIFAAIVLAGCALLLVRLLLGERRRYRFDSAMARIWRNVQRRWRDSVGRVSRMRQHRAAERKAEQVAKDAIRRASGGDWDGNVYRPKSFGKPPRDSQRKGDTKPPRDKMH